MKITNTSHACVDLITDIFQTPYAGGNEIAGGVESFCECRSQFRQRAYCLLRSDNQESLAVRIEHIFDIFRYYFRISSHKRSRRE